MKVRIKYISPSSLGAVLAIVYFVIGIAIGLFGVFASASGHQFTMSGPITFSGSGTEMLPFAILYPFLAAVVGGLAGYIIAWVYNLIAEYTRGISIELEKIERI